MKLNPWIHQSIIFFSLFNIAVGIDLFFYHPKIPFEVISPAIPQAVWASIFLASGLLMSYGLYKQYKEFVWYLMITGLFIKFCWTFGFGFRIFHGGTLFSVIIWGMIAAWQYLVVRYFHNERI